MLAALARAGASPISDNIERVLSSPPNERRESWRTLRCACRQPENLDDVVGALSGKNKDAAMACLMAVKGPVNGPIGKPLLRLVAKEDDAKILKTALQKLVELKVDGAAEAILRRIKKERRIKIQDTPKFGKGPDPRALLWQATKGRHIERVQVLGRSLLGLDCSATTVDLLLDRDELLCLGPGSTFARCALPAVNGAAGIASREVGLRRTGALEVIRYSTCFSGESWQPCSDISDELYSAVKKLLSSTDPDIRMAAYEAISRIRTPENKTLIRSLLADPDQRISKAAYRTLTLEYPEEYRDDILNSIWGRGPIKQLDALYLIARGRLPGIEEELERFIREEETNKPNDSSYRMLAAQGIWWSTGKKVEFKRFNNNYPSYPWEEKASSDFYSHTVKFKSELVDSIWGAARCPLKMHWGSSQQEMLQALKKNWNDSF
ncbi:MAG: HEAT repeat domain-containing protein [Elusimicrobiota bacterium]|nr:MAG: HEAT repeat domain-containing protein [Elusimicrobiota bacterium]